MYLWIPFQLVIHCDRFELASKFNIQAILNALLAIFCMIVVNVKSNDKSLVWEDFVNQLLVSKM